MSSLGRAAVLPTASPSTPAESQRRLGDPPYAILGIRSCDLHAVAIHDRVLRGPGLSRRPLRGASRRTPSSSRSSCSDPSGTCFCVSMGTGPRADSGYDLALTELLDGQHTFLARRRQRRGARRCSTGSGRGRPPRPTSGPPTRWSSSSVQRMGRSMDTTDIRTLLYENAEHPALGRRRRRGACRAATARWSAPPASAPRSEDHTVLSGDADRALAGLGLLLHLRLLLPARRQRPQQHAVALPAVDDAQAGVLDRPVRHLRLRRLRPVPRPGARSASTSPRRWPRSAPTRSRPQGRREGLTMRSHAGPARGAPVLRRARRRRR